MGWTQAIPSARMILGRMCAHARFSAAQNRDQQPKPPQRAPPRHPLPPTPSTPAPGSHLRVPLLLQLYLLLLGGLEQVVAPREAVLVDVHRDVLQQRLELLLLVGDGLGVCGGVKG
jgi:hypothetical protein